MPTEVKAPDGAIITFPDGTDQATMLRVMKNYTSGNMGGGGAPKKADEEPAPKPDAPLGDRIAYMQRKLQSRVPTDPSSAFSAGVNKGASSSLLGPIQLFLEKLFPKAGETFTKIVEAKNHVNDLAMAAHPALGGIGETTGAAVPYVAAGPAAPEGFVGRLAFSTGLGALAGGTQFSSAPTPEARNLDRLRGAVGGAAAAPVAEVAGTGLGRLVTRVGNSKAIGKLAEVFKSIARDTDPQINVLGGQLARSMKSTGDRYAALRAAQDQAGNKLGPVELPELVSKVQDVKNFLKGRVDQGGRVASLVKRLDYLTLENGSKIPPEVAKLGPATRNEVMKKLGLKTAGPKKLTYAQIRGISEDLDSYLSGKESQSLSKPQLQKLKDLKVEVDSALKEFEGEDPSLLKMKKKADKYYEDVVKPYQDPSLKGLMEGTPLDRIKTGIKIATSGDSSRAETMAKLLTPSSRMKVRDATIKNVLDDSMKEGELDVAKFSKRMQEIKPSFMKLGGKDLEEQMDGLHNLLTEYAQSTGKTPASHAHNKVGQIMSIVALERALTGHVEEGAALYGAAVGSNLITRVVTNMLNSAAGKHYLIAASKVKPGTPQMARLMNGVAKQFGSAAAGGTAAVNQE